MQIVSIRYGNGVKIIPIFLKHYIYKSLSSKISLPQTKNLILSCYFSYSFILQRSSESTSSKELVSIVELLLHGPTKSILCIMTTRSLLP